jgi:hypothetical protein
MMQPWAKYLDRLRAFGLSSEVESSDARKHLTAASAAGNSKRLAPPMSCRALRRRVSCAPCNAETCKP